MDPEVIFLLGAGASKEAGVPVGKEITDILINYSRYCPSIGSVDIENFLRYIQVKLATHRQVSSSEINFEYIIGTLSELSRRETYSVVPLLGDGDTLLRNLEKNYELSDIVRRIYSLLRELFLVRYSIDYLLPLADFLNLSKPLDIFTLNYDISLETALEKSGIDFTVGYRSRGSMYPIWDKSEFEKHDARVFKLHGSINWGQIYECSPPTIKEGIAWSDVDYYNNFPEQVLINHLDRDIVEPPDRTKGVVGIMNIGTRKELLYASSQFNTLFNYFLNDLDKAKCCVIAGYSFHDERINKILEEAVIVRGGDLRLIIVDPSNDLTRSSQFLKLYMRLGLITHIKKKFSEVLSDGSLSKMIFNPKTGEYESSDGKEEIFDDSCESLQGNRIKFRKSIYELGNLLDLANFHIVFLNDNFEKNLDKYRCDSEEIVIRNVFDHLTKSIRDLCYHLPNLNPYSGKNGPESAIKIFNDLFIYNSTYLEKIKINPKKENIKSLNIESIKDSICELNQLIYILLTNYNRSCNKLFQDNKRGFKINDDQKIYYFKDVIKYIYLIAREINGIYELAGYEDPFPRFEQ